MSAKTRQIPDYEKNYKTLMAIPADSICHSHKLVSTLAEGIDAALVLRLEAGCRHAARVIEHLVSQDVSRSDRSRLLFFLGNCWTNIRSIDGSRRFGAGKWICIETENAIRSYRRSLDDPSFEKLQPANRCQVLTNLGIELRQQGRYPEAIGYYDQAIRLYPKFGMATGGKGVALFDFARSMTVIHDGIPLMQEARRFLTLSATEFDFEVESAADFAALLEKLDLLHESGRLDMNNHRVRPLTFAGASHKTYSEWCCQHRLQLSPLNEIGKLARDSVHLQTISSSRMRSPALFGMFNQFKQEYVFARFSAYEGLIPKRPHWSDRDVLLVDTLDYPVYGLATERVRTAFRVAYSIFDKMAHFINRYWKLGIPETDVAFRRCWRKGLNPRGEIHPNLAATDNYGLIALFWLSRDLFEGGGGDTEPLDPHAREHYELRRHLEHAYVKVHSEWVKPRPKGKRGDDLFVDQLSYSINQTTLGDQTISLLSLVRVAVFYLIIAVNIEEAKSKRPALPGISLPIVPDRWKS